MKLQRLLVVLTFANLCLLAFLLTRVRAEKPGVLPVLNRREIQQILDLRILLESNAAALAAQNITLHQIEQLRAMHKSMGAAVAANHSQSYGQLNMAFHFEIYRIADNRLAASRLYGVFHADDPESFARSVALSFGVDVGFEPERITLGAPQSV